MHSSSTLRTALLALVATALIGPVLTPPAVATPTASSTSPTSSTSERSPSVKTRNRSYGGKVVQNSRHQRLRIHFRGAKGDLVALRSFPNPAPQGCESAVLRSLEDQTKVVQQVSALWRLPRSARYAVTYRADCAVSGAEGAVEFYKSGVRLSKVVTHPLVPGGPAVELPVENDVLHVAVLTVADARGVAVTGEHSTGAPSQYFWSSVLVPPSLAARPGRGDTFNSLPNDEGSPVIVRQGTALMQTSPRIEGGFWELPLHYPPARGFVPGVGDEIWFSDPRTAVVATAAYVD